jgi:hypothetical protein
MGLNDILVLSKTASGRILGYNRAALWRILDRFLRGEREGNMEQDRRDLFKKIGMLSASTLALIGVSKRAIADSPPAQNPLLGLWDLTIPGNPPLYYKYAISEGGYVATGNQDVNPGAFPPFTFSPTMGTYTRTGPNSYLIRERAWAMTFNSVPPGAPVGFSDFTGTAVVAKDGNSWMGSGTWTLYDLSSPPNVLSQSVNFPYSAIRFVPDPASPVPHAPLARRRGSLS